MAGARTLLLVALAAAAAVPAARSERLPPETEVPSGPETRKGWARVTMDPETGQPIIHEVSETDPALSGGGGGGGGGAAAAPPRLQTQQQSQQQRRAPAQPPAPRKPSGGRSRSGKPAAAAANGISAEAPPPPAPAAKPRGAAGGGGGGAPPRARARSGPILAPRRFLQFDGDANVRVLTVGTSVRSHALLVTDGGVHHHAASRPSWTDWLMGRPAQRVPPWSYLVAGDGAVLRRFRHSVTEGTPTGVAEDARTGRTAFTFYTALTNNVEVFAPDGVTSTIFEDVASRPGLPVWGRQNDLWVPFFLEYGAESDDATVGMIIYDVAGKRIEMFALRSFARVKMPYSLALDRWGRLHVAGLVAWVWHQGPYGNALNELTQEQTPPNRLDIYAVTDDLTNPNIQNEIRARWFTVHPEDVPLGTELEVNETMRAEVHLRGALSPIRSFDFPFICERAIMALTGDGHVLEACEGLDVIMWFAVHAPPSSDAAKPALLREHVHGGMVQHPCGIKEIGGIAMDPAGTAVYITDRQRQRVYSLAWPFEAGLANFTDADHTRVDVRIDDWEPPAKKPMPASAAY